jgi:hypothetical protein
MTSTTRGNHARRRCEILAIARVVQAFNIIVACSTPIRGEGGARGNAAASAPDSHGSRRAPKA